MVRFHAIQRTGGRTLRTEVHGACPEAARGIALAVVEAVAGPAGLGISDWGYAPRGFIEKRNAVVAGEGQSPALPCHHGADPLADIPDFFNAAARIQGENLVPLDVDVEQTVAMPERAFAPE